MNYSKKMAAHASKALIRPACGGWGWVVVLALLTSTVGHGQARHARARAVDRRGDRIEHRDSLALMYALRFYATRNWVVGVRPDMYDITTEQVTYRIDRLFYSPDHQRVVMWVSMKMPNARTTTVYNKAIPRVNRICPTGGDTIVDVVALIGLRSPKELWQLYRLDEQSVACACCADQARAYMEDYYFKRMKTDDTDVNKHFLDPAYGGKVDTDYVRRMTKLGLAPPEDSHFIPKQYGYNLQDPDFWTKSLLWQKGVLVPGLYLFETKSGAYPGFLDAPLSPPSVPYPEAIRKLY